jgi:hypothetical protein
MATFSVDLDIDDILWELSKREKQQLVDKLYDDGFTPSQIDTLDLMSEGNDNPMNVMWKEQILKLLSNRHKLTNEDEEIILKISNKI